MKRIVSGEAVVVVAIGVILSFVLGDLCFEWSEWRGWPMMEAMGTTAAAIIALWLGSRELVRQRHDQEKQKESVETLLGLEVDQNLAWLDEHWNKVIELEDPPLDPDLKSVKLAHKLLDLPFPQWTHSRWKSLTEFLPRALKKQDLRQVQEFYGRLDTLSAIRSKMLELRIEQMEANKHHDTVRAAGGAVPIASSLRFQKNAPALWEEYERIARTVLAAGNPLAH